MERFIENVPRHKYAIVCRHCGMSFRSQDELHKHRIARHNHSH